MKLLRMTSKSSREGVQDMAETLNVNRVFEAVARIVTQREEGVKVTLVEVKRVGEQEAVVGKPQGKQQAHGG